MTLNSIASLQPGDVLSAPKALGLIRHLGLVIGPNQVLQNTPERGEHVATVQEFARKRSVDVLRTGAHPNVVQARASAILRRPRTYDLLRNNCEHTVTKVLTGVGRSGQALLWISLAISAGVVWIILKRR